MPYIKQADRADDLKPSTPGELNFVLTRIVYAYWKERGNYQAINDVLGALEGAKLEFYRRVAAPYEDTKIAENGDVSL
jgi:hypothetical protein